MSISTVHIDADIVMYEVGFACEDETNIAYVLSTVNKVIEGIQKNTGATSIILHISGKENFRDDIATMKPYKGNRKDVVKPKWFNEIRDHLTYKWAYSISDNEEADDTLGRVCYNRPEHILASRDKDLEMIAGKHFNWKKDKAVREVTVKEADEFFAIQLLTGDGTDNIPGLFAVTGTKAMPKIKQRVLDAGNLADMYIEVVKIYTEGVQKLSKTYQVDEPLTYEQSFEVASKAVEEIGHLLWIRRGRFNTFHEYLDTLEPTTKEDVCLEEQEGDT